MTLLRHPNLYGIGSYLKVYDDISWDMWWNKDLQTVARVRTIGQSNLSFLKVRRWTTHLNQILWHTWTIVNISYIWSSPTVELSQYVIEDKYLQVLKGDRVRAYYFYIKKIKLDHFINE